MDTVKNDLREKINELEKLDKEKKKSEDVVLLKTERDFFKQEAHRLNDICQEQHKSYEKLRDEFQVKIDENKSLIEKWKETENLNKQIFLELENNLLVIRNLEQEKKILEKTNFQNFNNLQNIQNNISSCNNVNLKTPNFNNLYSNSYDKNSSKIRDPKLMNSTLYNSNSDMITENNEINNPQNFNNNFGTSMISFNNKELKENKENREICGNSNSIERKNNYNNFNNSNSNFIMNNQSIEDFDLMNSNNFNMNSSKAFNIAFESNFDKEKVLRFIEKLKIELKKEKTRNSKIVAEFNKILMDRKKLEKIFVESYDETRKDILQRKMRDTMQWKAPFISGGNKSLANSSASLPVLNDIKFENFQLTDKRKLLEVFFLSDEVMEIVKENLSSVNLENKTTSFFPKANFADNYTSKSGGNIKIKKDLKYISDLVKNNKNGNSKSTMNFTMSMFKK